jgi:4,5-dihydroxyphthalate decarboxylase
MAKIKLTIAVSEYDHVRDLLSGRVEAEGIELVPLNLEVEEIFWRFARYREWDVSEMSFGNYTAIRSREPAVFSAIPVFPSRVFRHSCFYVRRESGFKRLQDLRGRRVGLPEWVQTACVYARGLLVHQGGVRLDEVEWIQSGVNEPGRQEKVPINLPSAVRLTRRHDKSLDAMLRAGEIDAIMSARAPASFENGDADTVRLFPQFQPLEEEYWRATGIFPIMHTICVRGEVLREYPWVAMNLYKAFEEAKRRSLERLFQIGVSRVALPWLSFQAETVRPLFRGDYWPYGVEQNRVTLEAFLSFCNEQGITPRLMKPEELFAEETATSFRV